MVPAARFGNARAPGLHTRQHRLRQVWAQVAIGLGLAAVDVLSHPAAEGDDVGQGVCGQALQPQQRGGAGARRPALQHFEQAIGHVLHQTLHPGGVHQAAHFKRQAHFGGQAGTGRFEACHAATGVQADDARADVYRGLRHHRTVFAQGNLARAAADVDVHHAAGLADAARRRARTHRGQRGFKRVAGADGDELAGLRCEQFTDGAGIAATHCHPGEDQRAAVDLLGAYAGQGVLRVDKHAQRISVDGHVVSGAGSAEVGRQQHIAFMQHGAFSHDVAAVQPLQPQPRKHQMRGAGADVDTDADEHDFVFKFQAAADVAEEDPSAVGRRRTTAVRRRGTHPAALLAVSLFFASTPSGFSYSFESMRDAMPLACRSASYSARRCGSSIQ